MRKLSEAAQVAKLCRKYLKLKELKREYVLLIIQWGMM